jgi:hypothetical protein
MKESIFWREFQKTIKFYFYLIKVMSRLFGSFTLFILFFFCIITVGVNCFNVTLVNYVHDTHNCFQLTDNYTLYSIEDFCKNTSIPLSFSVISEIHVDEIPSKFPYCKYQYGNFEGIVYNQCWELNFNLKFCNETVTCFKNMVDAKMNYRYLAFSWL